jgi:conjugal transfer pilus assembly protein TraW
MSKGAIKQLLIITAVLAVGSSCYGTDFGVEGQTFVVAEESFVVMLKKRLEQVDMEQEQLKIQQRAKESVNNPKPVSAIKPAANGRVFYFDPTYTLDKDAVLPCGRILHRAGTRVNPLEHMQLERRMFFVDARQQEQISWLKEQLQHKKQGLVDRVILVDGSVFKMQDELGVEHADKVYFDQHGELTSKFGIHHSPAEVMQEGSKLKIEEVCLYE